MSGWATTGCARSLGGILASTEYNTERPVAASEKTPKSFGDNSVAAAGGLEYSESSVYFSRLVFVFDGNVFGAGEGNDGVGVRMALVQAADCIDRERYGKYEGAQWINFC